MASGPDVQSLLLEIREANGGVLTAQAVVDAARPLDHPLHQHFEWDDEKAGDSFRKQQARALIRVVKLQYVDKRGEVQKMRVFHSVSDPESLTGRSYVPLDEIQASELMTAELRRRMEIDWRNLHRRYKHFAEFIQMVQRDTAGAATGTDGPDAP
jgi:hypothetical protein